MADAIIATKGGVMGEASEPAADTSIAYTAEPDEDDDNIEDDAPGAPAEQKVEE
jgi:hypothetical protein